MDDLFAADDKSGDVFEEMKDTKPNTGFTAKKENYWDKLDIEPMEIDVTKFKKTGKSFAVYVFPENDIPQEAHDKIVTLAKGLMSKGYVFRHTGNADHMLHNDIMAAEGAKVKSYLPWKGYNKNITTPILASAVGYRVSIAIHKSFLKLPAAVRAILGKDVNALLGEEATDPTDFVLAWTDGGAEALTKNTDFKKIGHNTFVLQVARRANLPVLNVYNSNFIERFKEIIS